MDALAEELLEKETLTRSDIDSLLERVEKN
jgi:hypothetical protein